MEHRDRGTEMYRVTVMLGQRLRGIKTGLYSDRVSPEAIEHKLHGDREAKREHRGRAA